MGGVLSPGRLRVDDPTVGTLPPAYFYRRDEPHSTVQVECKFFGPFRDDVGVERVDWELSADATVGDLLRDVEATYPVLEGRLVDEEAASTAGQTVVSVDEKNVRHLDGLDTALEAGDVVRLVPSVYGG